MMCRLACSLLLASVWISSFAQSTSNAPFARADKFSAGDGTSASPAYSFSSAPGLGFYKRRDGDGQGFLFAAGGGRGLIALTSGTLALQSAHELIWSSVTDVDHLQLATNDLRLARDGAGILSIKGGSGPGLRIYGVYNGSSSINFERLAVNTTPGAVVMKTEAAGSGTLRSLQLGTGSNAAWIFDAQGNFGRGTASPKATVCGTSSSVEGRDSAFVVKIGEGAPPSTCTVTFGTAWTNAPSCVANSSADAEPLLVSTIAGSVTIRKATAFTGGSRLHVHCAGV